MVPRLMSMRRAGCVCDALVQEVGRKGAEDLLGSVRDWQVVHLRREGPKSPRAPRRSRMP